jgi:hypothetical protein
MSAASGLDVPAPASASGAPSRPVPVPVPVPARFAVLGGGPLGGAVAEALAAYGAVDRIDEGCGSSGGTRKERTAAGGKAGTPLGASSARTGPHAG